MIYSQSMAFYWFRLINIIQKSDLLPESLRRSLLRSAGVTVDTARVTSGVHFMPAEIEIANGSYIGQQTILDANAPIQIKRNVYIASRCVLTTATHEIGEPTHRAGQHKLAPITIEDGAWLGTNVIVLPGVIIASGCIIAAGSVVTKSTEPNGMYAGVPARRKRDLS